MRKLKPIAILCFFTGMLFSGQTGKIAGIVTDASSGGALIGCNVLVKGTSQGASTDANGEYFIINLSPGSYDLEFSMIGYAAYTAEGVSVNIDVTTPLNAAVSTEAVAMSGIVVTAEQPAIENTLTSTKQIVSGDMMSRMAVTDVNDVVKTLPGVTEVGGDLHIRGGRSGEEMYLVDGASVTNAVMGGEAIPVNPGMVGELQLITGTFNAEYGQAMSGLFNTVLREPAAGFHASFGYRTTLGQEYFKADAGTFSGTGVYAETMEIVDDEGAYTDAAENTDYTKTAFGGEKTIMDFSAGFGTSALGGVFSLRTLDDGGRLPGLAEDLQNVQAKLNYQLGSSLKLSAEAMYYTRNGFYDPSYDAERMDAGMDIWQWLWAMDQYPVTEESATQFGVTANYVMSPSTNITVRADMMMRNQEDGAQSADGKFVDFETSSNAKVTATTSYNGAEGPNHTKVMEDRTNSNAWYNTENVYGHYFKSKETITTIGAHATSQLNNRHQLKAGFDYRMFDLDRSGHDVWYGRTLGYTEANPRLQHNSFGGATPTEIAAYAQDQMEFNDMILNVGLRFDGFDAGSDKGVWANDAVSEAGADATLNPFDPSKRSATTMKTQISPRLGASFPVGDNMAFRYAYGSFFQRPEFYSLLNNHMAQMDGGTESGFFIYLGNADLDPMKNTIYEMGLQYSLASNLKLDVSGYHRDISNLQASQEVYAIPFRDSTSADWVGTGDAFEAAHYSVMVSDHFGDVRGLETSLSKTGQSGLTGRVSYTFSIARGTASDKINAGNGSLTQDGGGIAANMLTMTTLDWHRPHILNGYVDYHMDMSGLLQSAGVNLTFNAQSGLPVSARSGVGGASLSQRAPSTIDLNLKLDARLSVAGISPTLYLLVENVMNNQNVVAIADPGSFFDEASAYHNIAAGSSNNLLAYGKPMTLNFGVQINY